MANIMRCCKCETTWSKKETDLKFYILRIDFSQPFGTTTHPNYWRTCTYSDFKYSTGTGPCDYKEITTYPQAKIEDDSDPSSGCACTDSCGGTPEPETFLNEEVLTGGTYIYTYQGYWSRRSGSGCPAIIYGRHEPKYLRQFIKEKFKQPYRKSHYCGNYCPGCGPATPANKDGIQNAINNWKTWTPPC